ncbi:lysine exporter protein LysE/YggA [Roseibium sp. TrichSKD4]|uniref:LysE family translocator n=1 Tax=Roseibium sp. TrichSKD4 TaxID=744980 RepID=UPI0001E5630D|nr:LysE family translocator [Roseibium sp. TrichSKD4]EFO33853.1 lysine exporter protein LysE/YggA [Roseibium sp. TrichSKD4]
MFDFLPSLAVLLTFSAASLVLILAPGPDMALFLGKTIAHGRSNGFAAVLGAATGVVVHSVLAALGVSILLATSETAFFVLKVLGAGYLVWLAYQSIRHGTNLVVETGETERETALGSWFHGVCINLLNPKIVLFFVTFLPQFIHPADPNAAAKLLFLGLYFTLLATPICFAMVACASQLVTTLKRSPRILRVFDWGIAGVMGTFAIKLLATQASGR